MSLRRSLRGLSNLVLRQKTRGTAQLTKIEIIAGLKKTYDAIEEDDALYLETRFLDYISVKCEQLDFNDDGSYATAVQPCFFRPMPLSKLLAHPIDTQSAKTQRTLAVQEDLIESRYSGPHQDRADAMCQFMEWQFRGYPRKGSPVEGQNLMSLTKWKPG